MWCPDSGAARQPACYAHERTLGQAPGAKHSAPAAASEPKESAAESEPKPEKKKKKKAKESESAGSAEL